MITAQQALDICRQRGACDYVDEIHPTWSDIAAAIFTPQGIEYVTTERLPIEAWRSAPREELRALGIYVDAGEVNITRFDTETQVCLIGATHAAIRFSGVRLLKVILLNGASVDIDATDYAVVSVRGKGEKNVKLDNTAKELCSINS